MCRRPRRASSSTSSSGPPSSATPSAGGYITCAPVEKSGQEEFDFEYGDAWAAHIDSVAPTFAKVLVRYNPEGDAALNRRQAERLRSLSEYLRGRPSRLMFELLVPAEAAQLTRVGGDKRRYDLELRPGLMGRAIRELQDAGVDPDIWKIEGLDRREDCVTIVEHRPARRPRRRLHRAGPGRERATRPRLARHRRRGPRLHRLRRRTHHVLGSPRRLEERQDTRDAAVTEVARRYREWVDLFEHARGA